MSNFSDMIKTNPPRLVVLFNRGEDGTERFQWGIVGEGLPVLTLIGYITGVQSDLAGQLAEQCNECPESAFVITLTDGNLEWYVHRDIPVYSLVGMLETIKMALVGGRIAQQAAAQRVQLLGPDGQPYKL